MKKQFMTIVQSVCYRGCIKSLVKPCLVSCYQCGGVGGRQIHEGVLVANELINSRNKCGEPGLIYKLDFNKVFDMVSREFLEKFFVKLGSGPKWRSWMLTCWKTARFSMLVYGSPCGFFYATRGFKQGDPLSPMIFALVVESLTQLNLCAQSKGIVRGFTVCNNGEVVPILQYEDDIVVFLEANEVIVENLKALLVWFEVASGLHVNAHKTKVFQS